MHKIKREQVVVACGQCRKSRTKCSGDRPVCDRCRERSLQCQYSADADANPMTALKRKYSALNEAYTQQSNELSGLRTRLKIDVAKSSLEVTMNPSSANLHSNQRDIGNIQPRPDSASLLNSSCSNLSSSQRGTKDITPRMIILLNALASKSDAESITLFARIRSGEDWHDIAQTLLDEQLPSLVENRADADFQQREAQPTVKPWLPAMFDRQHFLQIRCMCCFPGPYTPLTSPDGDLLFGNLPFASAIAANHYPPYLQQMQQRNMIAPNWAKVVLNGDTALEDPFESAFREMVRDVSLGIAADEFCGPHVYLAALDDADVYQRAPKLSQLAARAIKSIKITETSITFTQCAMMYWFWALWRWMLMPSKATYRDIPAFAQPTPSQLLMPHPSTFDFVLTPGLRDLMCQTNAPNVQWFTEAAITIECLWEGDVFSAFCRDGLSNELDFNPICKMHISSEHNWALGKSVRSFLPTVDSFVRIREGCASGIMPHSDF